MTTTGRTTAPRTGGVLLTLAAAQFLMTLDTSVMNVSIASVAKDVGTDVTGIQTAITLYTLVMASFMITGGKIGEILGRKRAFSIGCVIYGAGSLITALAHSLPVLIVGWSVLEGLGATLIMPAVVALVASNFERSERPRAYGLVASAGAIAVAVGPIIGGFFTTYSSWRWVFVGEVIITLVILAFNRRTVDSTPTDRPKLDIVGAALSAAAMSMIVLSVLRSGQWGMVVPRAGAPSILGLSAAAWMLLAGALLFRGFLTWERRQIERGQPALIDPLILENRQLRAGLGAFFLQYLLQAGLFFTVPLFLSVALGLSAIATGVRILPLSITLLAAAIGIPRMLPTASPRQVVQTGFAILFLGIVVMIGALDAGAGPEIVTWPMLLAGLGIGTLASQLGAVTVSAVPDEASGEVGGLQNTLTNLGASIGTAVAGTVLIASLSASFLSGIADNPQVPSSLTEQARVELEAGVPFVSDAQLRSALDDSDLDPATADAIVDANTDARIDGLRTALALLAVVALAATVFGRRLPDTPVSEPVRSEEPDRD